MRSLTRQQGLTAVELSLAVMLLGAIALLVVNLLPTSQEAAREAAVSDQVSRVHAALEGFAFIHARLPWADSSGNGLEDPGATAGYLPYRSLGMSAPLRNPWGLDYHYAVYVRPDPSPHLDVELTVAKDRLYPFIAEGLLEADGLCPADNPTHSSPCGEERILGNTNSLDFCFALGTAQSRTFNANYLHVRSGGFIERVAYLLVDPNAGDANHDGSPFDGLNSPFAENPNPMEFEHPIAPRSNTNNDTVYVRHFNDLRERMGCTGIIAAVGHAHPNVETTAALFRQSIRDYKIQLELQEMLRIAEVMNATTKLAYTTSTMANVTATGISGVASLLFGNFAATAGKVLVAAGAITGAANIVMASIDLADAVDALEQTRQYIAESNAQIADLDLLYWGAGGSLDNPQPGSIRYNVREADALGVFNH